jgi:DNA-binding GntR family transcriptional regulator
MSVAMEKAYRALWDRILSGEFRPGDRLKERDLCADLDVSRTPVREALRRLEADGLVVIEPRRGGTVADLSPEEADEIYALGAILESYAAKLAARRARPDDLASLDAVVRRMRDVVRQDDAAARRAYLDLDRELHDRIIAMAGNRRLAAMLKQVVRLPVLVHAFQRYSVADLAQSLHDHESIVAALRAGDDEWAESAMRGHILAGRAILRTAAD